MRKTQMLIDAAIVALALSAVSAKADVISQSNTLIGSSSEFQTFGGSFNQFDGSLGTLDTVTIGFAGQQTFTTTCAQCSSPAPYGYSVGYNFNAPGFPFTTRSLPFYVLINETGLVNSSTPKVDGPISFNSGLLDADVSAIAAYIGLGTVDVAGFMSEDSDFCSSLRAPCSLSNALTLTTTLTYNFTPIPEPITLTMFGVGLTGIGAAARKRRRTA